MKNQVALFNNLKPKGEFKNYHKTTLDVPKNRFVGNLTNKLDKNKLYPNKQIKLMQTN